MYTEPDIVRGRGVVGNGSPFMSQVRGSNPGGGGMPVWVDFRRGDKKFWEKKKSPLGLWNNLFFILSKSKIPNRHNTKALTVPKATKRHLEYSLFHAAGKFFEEKMVEGYKSGDVYWARHSQGSWPSGEWIASRVTGPGFKSRWGRDACLGGFSPRGQKILREKKKSPLGLWNNFFYILNSSKISKCHDTNPNTT